MHSIHHSSGPMHDDADHHVHLAIGPPPSTRPPSRAPRTHAHTHHHHYPSRSLPSLGLPVLADFPKATLSHRKNGGSSIEIRAPNSTSCLGLEVVRVLYERHGARPRSLRSLLLDTSYSNYVVPCCSPEEFDASPGPRSRSRHDFCVSGSHSSSTTICQLRVRHHAATSN